MNAYEEGKVEDRHSGDCVDSDGSTDGTGNDLVHGERTFLSHRWTRKDTEEVIITERSLTQKMRFSQRSERVKMKRGLTDYESCRSPSCYSLVVQRVGDGGDDAEFLDVGGVLIAVFDLELTLTGCLY